MTDQERYDAFAVKGPAERNDKEDQLSYLQTALEGEIDPSLFRGLCKMSAAEVHLLQAEVNAAKAATLTRFAEELLASTPKRRLELLSKVAGVPAGR